LDERRDMDISSDGDYPSSMLSNFAPHAFVLDGVLIASMEGFLQSLKFSEVARQRDVCMLVGKAAKLKGQEGSGWQLEGKLHWNGQDIDRFSDKYQRLLDRAFETLYTTNEAARRALLATGEAVLEHSIGNPDAKQTVLTQNEFCSRLTQLRRMLAPSGDADDTGW
jgi:predicted NAD-dependent protein-ADP-ribosyltransferase YbiA (DUF1768 family)